MRRYLRCPGAICCPARRALRAVLQPHIRFCDELIVVDRAEHVGELLGLVSERLGSVLKHRLQHGEHRQGDPHLLALFRLRSTGLGVAVGATRSCRGRHRPRASPQSPNGPTRARLKPQGSPAATRSNAFRPLEKFFALSQLRLPGPYFFTRWHAPPARPPRRGARARRADRCPPPPAPCRRGRGPRSEVQVCAPKNPALAPQTARARPGGTVATRGPTRYSLTGAFGRCGRTRLKFRLLRSFKAPPAAQVRPRARLSRTTILSFYGRVLGRVV